MATIIEFPNANEREWRDLESLFRDTYKDTPDGTATIEECLPTIKSAWRDLFASFSVQPRFSIPGPLTREQEAAVLAAVEQAAELVAERLKSERSRCFGMIAAHIYDATYWRRKSETS